VGRKGRDYFRRRKLNMTRELQGATGETALARAKELAAAATEEFLNGTVDGVWLVYNQFKSVMSSIADTLKTDAQSATGPQAQHLTDLANKFSQAAQTGQMPDLQPPGQQQGASGHHHHHHHQVSSYQNGSSSSTSNPSQPKVDLAQIIQTALQQASG